MASNQVLDIHLFSNILWICIFNYEWVHLTFSEWRFKSLETVCNNCVVATFSQHVFVVYFFKKYPRNLGTSLELRSRTSNKNHVNVTKTGNSNKKRQWYRNTNWTVTVKKILCNRKKTVTAHCNFKKLKVTGTLLCSNWDLKSNLFRKFCVTVTVTVAMFYSNWDLNLYTFSEIKCYCNWNGHFVT